MSNKTAAKKPNKTAKKTAEPATTSVPASPPKLQPTPPGETEEQKTARLSDQQALHAQTVARLDELTREYGAEGLETTDGIKVLLAAIPGAPNATLARQHAERAYQKHLTHILANWKVIRGPAADQEKRAEKVEKLAGFLEQKGESEKAMKLRETAKKMRAGEKVAKTKKAAAPKATKRAERDPRLPKVGTVLERPFKGKTYRVEVLEDGFRSGGK